MTSAEWTAADITLNPGIIGVEEDTGRTKIGDGRRSWNRLPYDGGYITHILSADTGYTLGANIDITHPTGWVYADIEAIGSGGGGASGGCHASGVVSRGGGAGSSGSLTIRRIYAAHITNSFFRCIIPAGGAGGASVSADADGNAGVNGENLFVYDGASAIKLVHSYYGFGGSVTTTAPQIGSEYGVVAGVASSATGTVGTAGTSSAIGGAGSGGGITTADAWSAGGTSGRTLSNPVAGSELGAVTAAGTTEGAAGSNGNSSALFYCGRSGGGGASSTTGSAGAGGNGGKYGGAGGGGGGSRVGVGASGKGGDGAPGIIKITYAL